MTSSLAPLLGVAVVVIGIMFYSIIKRLRHGRWIDRQKNGDVA